MKKILFILLIITVSAVFIYIRNSDTKLIISRLAKKNSQIRPGELKYRVYLLGFIYAGEAVLAPAKAENYQGQNIYHLNATAQTLKAFSKFFQGSAILDSYIDKEHLNPLIFKQKIYVSGKPDINKQVKYDQKKHTTLLAGVERQILPNTQDPLSAIFNFGRTDFDKTRELEMNINTNHKNYILKANVRNSAVSVNGKTYKLAIAEATIKRRGKNPYHQSQVTITFLKEKENIPILIRVFASGILINAKLIDIK